MGSICMVRSVCLAEGRGEEEEEERVVGVCGVCGKKREKEGETA